MRLRHAIFVTALITPVLCLSSFAQSPFTVGTATAAPGQKATGYLEVPAGVDAATSIPVVVVNGAKPGKVLALISGAHGTESERASYLITKEIVDRCDYLIDYHGGDLDESLRPYAYWGPTGREAQD